MKYEAKFLESEYFLRRMYETRNIPGDFRFELSAFLSSVRSPIQYAFEAVKGTSKQNKFDNEINKSPRIKYIKEKRDYNIHVSSNPICEYTTVQTDSFEVSVIGPSVTIQRVDENYIPISSVILSRSSSGELSKTGDIDKKILAVLTNYKFSDWSGLEYIHEFCELVLLDTKEIIKKLKTDGSI